LHFIVRAAKFCLLIVEVDFLLAFNL